MKNFILSEILLLSPTEKKAKRVKFDPIRTIILGKNETGKSSLLKSIYATFGAVPAKQNGDWKKLNPISFVRFEIDGIKFSILKDGKNFSIFDNRDEILGTFSSITNELGPYLAQLFNFKVQLANQEGKLITPPPAFLFLPFYIDQDVSWQEAWKAFNNLSQIKKYKKPIIEYHTGLRPNEYYETKNEIEEIEVKINALDQEKKLSRTILEKLKEKFTSIDFALNIDDFQDEIKSLLLQCENLQLERDKVRNTLVDLVNNRIKIDTQITITKQALNEARQDFNFASLDVDDNIDCPTCGAHYENTFIERFEIALDENGLKDLLLNLTRDLNDISDRIDKENKSLSIKSQELLRLEEILERKKGEVKLRDVIESEGKKELKIVFTESIESLQGSILEQEGERKTLNEKLKSFNNKKKKEAIYKEYRDYMYLYLKELGVSLNEDYYKDFLRNISNTGSVLPRSLTAYYFSILNIVKTYSTSAFCPIIIDSPNQQAQDSENIDKMLHFIYNHQPKGSQMILGLENTFNIDFGYTTIVLEEKKALLQASEYEEVHKELDFYFNKIWANGNKGSGKLFNS